MSAVSEPYGNPFSHCQLRCVGHRLGVVPVGKHPKALEQPTIIEHPGAAVLISDRLRACLFQVHRRGPRIVDRPPWRFAPGTSGSFLAVEGVAHDCIRDKDCESRADVGGRVGRR